jgi:hypothetical protein
LRARAEFVDYEYVADEEAFASLSVRNRVEMLERALEGNMEALKRQVSADASFCAAPSLGTDAHLRILKAIRDRKQTELLRAILQVFHSGDEAAYAYAVYVLWFFSHIMFARYMQVRERGRERACARARA